MGLLIFESSEAVENISQGHEIEVDPDQGIIQNLTTGVSFRVAPIPPFMKQLIDDGGLIEHIKKQSKAG
jgi:3-isopropylmalate/(R)-2-methylmalate dehydratase small subunit